MDDVEIISVDGPNLIFKGFRYENLYLVYFNAREAQLSICLITKGLFGTAYAGFGFIYFAQIEAL